MNKIHIYCDGSANPNPGPCGYAIVALKQQQKYLQVYQFLGQGTNQIAQMIGMRQALRIAGSKEAVIYTDSEWVINICSGKWKANYYKQTWEQIKKLKRQNHQLVWVKGHNKNKYNQQADALAKKAVSTNSSVWVFLRENCDRQDIQTEKYWRKNLSNYQQLKKIMQSRLQFKELKTVNGNNLYFKKSRNYKKQWKGKSRQFLQKKYNKHIKKNQK